MIYIKSLKKIAGSKIIKLPEADNASGSVYQA
jgi:hypothetical protein